MTFICKFIILLLNIKIIFSFGTVPFVCDVNESFMDIKLPSLATCLNESIKYSVINASLWEENYIEVDSILYRSIIKKCDNAETNKIHLDIIHTGNYITNYIDDDTFLYPTNSTYNMIITLEDKKYSNKWLVNECYKKKPSSNTGRYSEIKKFTHRFYANYSIIKTNLDDERIANQIIRNCFHENRRYLKNKSNTYKINYNLDFKEGRCIYIANVDGVRTLYKYLWNTNIKDQSVNYIKYLPKNHNIIYKNVFPYKLIDSSVSLKLIKNYFDIPSKQLLFDDINVDYYDNIMTCIGTCKYFITYPINTNTVCEKTTTNEYDYKFNCYISSNLMATKEMWLTVLMDKYNYINGYKGNKTINKKPLNPKELILKDKETYENLFGDSTSVNMFDDNILENSILEGQTDYINLKINNIVNNVYILCQNIKNNKNILHTLCKTNAYRCVTALLGFNNIKVIKEHDILKIKPCKIVQNYEFMFEHKNSYDNKSCYYDIPIKYKINNTEYYGYFNTDNGEIFSESFKITNCPIKYRLELNNTVYDIYNNTMHVSDKKPIIILNEKKINIYMPVYKDIVPQIDKIKNLPNLQDIKTFESTDEIFSDIISQNDIIHEYIPPNFNDISEFFAHLFDSPLKILMFVTVILTIIFLIILAFMCLPSISICCNTCCSMCKK